jgi:hypothetical protein
MGWATDRANARPMINSAIPSNCIGGDGSRVAQPILRPTRFSNSQRDTNPHSRGEMRPRFSANFPLKTRAQGKPGARCTRSLAWELKKPHEHSHHRFTGVTRPSLRNGFNGLFRALPGDRALLPPSFAQGLPPRKLDASVGASGPHDFAGPRRCHSSVAPARPSHLAPNVRDDRETSLLSGARRLKLVAVICPTAQAKYFLREGWTRILQNCPSGN